MRPWRHLLAYEGDFGNHYLAATLLRQGFSPFGLHAFDYPPLPAFLVVPLSLLPYDGARQVWLVIGQLSLVAAAWLTWRALGGGRAELLVVAGAWGVAGTLAVNLVLGQIHPIMLLLLAGALAALSTRPKLAGALIGGAIAVKLWPAMLAAALVPARRWRAAGSAIVIGGLLILGPLLLLRVGWPPPHLPTSTGYWMGTPAPLNASWPAVALRTADPPRVGEPIPIAWRQGNNPDDLQLPAAHRALSVAVALATLALGSGALLWAYGWKPSAGGGNAAHRPTERDLLLLGATLSLVVLASPISWYHYQIFQLLPASVLGLVWLRRRAFLHLAFLAALLAAVTRLPAWSFGRYVDRFGWEVGSPALLWLATTSGPALGTALLALLVLELRRGRRPAGATEPVPATTSP